jgi:hypothetical protein
LIINEKEEVIYLSETVEGKVHDKRLLEKIDWNKRINLHGDLGFLGYENSRVRMELPYKKKKGKELEAKEKAINREKSKIRVKIEQVIGKIKILRILKDKIRNYAFDFKNKVMKIGVQLYNFKISHYPFCS